MHKEGQEIWEGCGVSIEKARTLPTALKMAGIDWSVNKVPLAWGTDPQIIPGRYALVRGIGDNPVALGIVKKNYGVTQNHEAFQLCMPWIKEGAATFHAAGYYDNGATVWMMLRLRYPKGAIWATKDDEIIPYVLLTNSFDSRPLAAHLLPVRASSRVTLGVIGLGMRVGHMTSLDRRVNPSFNLKEIWAAYQDVMRVCRQMALTSQTRVTAEESINHIVHNTRRVPGSKVSPRLCHMRELARAQLDSVYNVRARGTVWATYNAIAEYVEWRQCCPNEEAEPKRRVAFVWFGHGARLRHRALTMFSSKLLDEKETQVAPG